MGRGLILLLFSVLPGFAWAGPPDFETEIVPILLTRCVECHHSENPSGKLDLTNRDGLHRGGDSGPVLDPTDPDRSYLLERVNSSEMPPAIRGIPQQLPRAERDLLRAWIRSGTTWPIGRTLDLYEKTTTVRAGRDWWSLQPLGTAAPPPGPADHPIDAFLDRARQARGLVAAGPATDRQRLRRLYLTTIGLNPSPGDYAAFETDPSPNRWLNSVDRVLASPHFGERWARHWLDLVRFAETSGYERDQQKPGAWRYRDWVIRSLNDDKPFDRFVSEQLAGDELTDRSEETVIATGFLRLGTWNDEPNDPAEYQYERLEDLVHATTTTFLGLTVKCARCHDHKFDPIPQRDYYRTASMFWPGPVASRDRKLLGGPSTEELGFDVLGWTDLTNSPPPLKLLVKGDPKRPGPPVDPGFLTLLPELDQSLTKPPEDARTTHRRLQFANWMVHPDNPLTPRVIVNRIWQHHLGTGLVRTPNNFGFRGDPPTHPELLDWLAAELVRGDWSLKRIHRLILTSAAFQQSSEHPDFTAQQQQDSGNFWLWHSNRRRLDAETMRDCMLQAAGTLDVRMHGPSFRPSISAEALEGLSRKGSAWQASPDREQLRRAVYIYAQRSLLVPLLTTFDAADTISPCGMRNSTTVPTQALALMNNGFIHSATASMARNQATAHPVTPADSDDWDALVRDTYLRCLGRAPDRQEIHDARRFLLRQRNRLATGSVNPSSKRDSGTANIIREAVLDLNADIGVVTNANHRVQRWGGTGTSPAGTQPVSERQPRLRGDRWNGHATVDFDGQNDFLLLPEDLLEGPEYTLIVVASDRTTGRHREIISNWNGSAGNSVTSVFLGATAADRVRFSDQFSTDGFTVESGQPFVIAAINRTNEAVIHLNGRKLGSRSGPLTMRELRGRYVIGQQGNIDGEYWDGEIARLLVFDRSLPDPEFERLQRNLMVSYGVRQSLRPDSTPRELAVALLAQVLLSSNEFLYFD